VDDADDPRLHFYRDLNDPAGRLRRDMEQSVFVVEGRLAVDRLLTSSYSVRSLLIDVHQLTAASDLVSATRAAGAPVFVASRAVVADTVASPSTGASWRLRTDRPPLIRARAGYRRPDSRANGNSSARRCPRGPQRPREYRALFRNAAAFGVAGVLLDPTCADPLYRRSVRVSVGHVLHIPFARVTSWPDGLHQLRAAGFVVAALAPRAAAADRVSTTSLVELASQISGPGQPVGVALLLGAEGPGLSAAALAACDMTVSIPMADGVDSLNVATAAAVAFFASPTAEVAGLLFGDLWRDTSRRACAGEERRWLSLPERIRHDLGVELRQVHLDDPICEPLLAGLSAEYQQRYGEQDEMAMVTPDEFEPPSGAFVVLVASGRLVSGGGLRRLDEQVCEVKRMLDRRRAPGERLRHRGAACLEEAALELGYRVIRLETGPRQPEAVALYEKNGYRRIPTFGRYPQAIAFEKTLAAVD